MSNSDQIDEIKEEIKEKAANEFAAFINATANHIRVGNDVSQKSGVPNGRSMFETELKQDGKMGPKYTVPERENDRYWAAVKSAAPAEKALTEKAEGILNEYGLNGKEDLRVKQDEITGHKILNRLYSDAVSMAEAIVRAEKALQKGNASTTVPPAALPDEPQEKRQR